MSQKNCSKSDPAKRLRDEWSISYNVFADNVTYHKKMVVTNRLEQLFHRQLEIVQVESSADRTSDPSPCVANTD